MRIDSITAEFPSRILSNEDVVGLIERHSADRFEGDLPRTLRRIEQMLEFSGAERRRWRSEGDVALDLVRRAARRAFAEAGVRPGEIDVLIYVGVGRGFIEPANAYFIAHALGMDSAQCFDILDACNSWVRALFLLNALFRTGHYRRALIINAEFNLNVGYPRLFQLESEDAIEWSFPAYTIGEGTTATIVSPDDDNEWIFAFDSKPGASELCHIPLEGWDEFCEKTERIARNGVGNFVSYGAELFAAVSPLVLDTFARMNVPASSLHAVFPHAASRRVFADGPGRLGVKHLFRYVYPEYGNLVSASVPAGIALAVEAGDVLRGHRIAGMVGSAGASASAFTCVY